VAVAALVACCAAACADIAGLGDPPTLAADGGPEDATTDGDASSIDATPDADVTVIDADADVHANADADADADADDGDGATIVTVGCGTSCALAVTWVSSCVVSDGGVLCWGGDYASLGRGPSTSTAPGPVLLDDGFTPLAGVRGIVGGGDTTCAFLTDGGVACWGLNAFALPDAGTTLGYATPVDALANAVEIALDQSFGCWRRDSVSESCAGNNTWGQLGNGVTSTDAATTPVRSGFAGPLVQIAAGRRFQCAAVEDGGLHCVGENDYGECRPFPPSQDILDASESPQLGHPVSSIALGALAGCGVGSADTQVYCWGDGENGAIGTPTNGKSRIQTADGGPLSGVTALAGGHDFFCALTNDGHVWCWGENDQGQLGHGTVADAGDPGVPAASPVLDADGGVFGDVVQIAAALDHACALKQNGQVWCWGGADPWNGPLWDAGFVANPMLAH
jgi:alpha-tubulin suppressor-like RCC1 family protein